MFKVRGRKLSKPIEPDDATSKGSLLLSVSCGEWSEVMQLIILLTIPFLTNSIFCLSLRGGESLANVRHFLISSESSEK